MSITVREESYENFGRCLYISNQKQEMRVTLDVGPRIISYNLVGKDNMMFTDIERVSYRDNEQLKAVYGKDSVWYIYGGHRFWISPEQFPETYYPDNDRVEYTRDGCVFTFTPPVQRVTGWLAEIEITFSETDAEAKVRHILTNKSDKQKTGSVWAMSVTAEGGNVVQKWAKEDTGLLANRTFMLWSYNNMADKRFYMDSDYVALCQDKSADTAFKIGTNNTLGSVICVNNGTVFKKEYTHISGALYPDNGCSTEVFSDKYILEMETLSPLYNLEPGESCEHIENWSLIPTSSVNLEDVVTYL